MTTKQFLISIFLNQPNSISSKRVCGALGWLLCLVILGYCTFKQVQAPVMIDSIVIASTTLLGVDSIANIWKDNRDSNDYYPYGKGV